MRISIIGNCASGKSTLARKISEKFQIPHLHLDRLWFESGAYKLQNTNDINGFEKARAHIKKEVEDFIKQKDWVSDGWYSKVQQIITNEADLLIFLDIPLLRRISNHLWRIFASERHVELSRWDDIKFTFEIVRRTFSRNIKLHQFTRENHTKLVVLKTYKQIDRFLLNLK